MPLPQIPLLEALVSIAESPSLAQAAQKLNLTQPALSMQLKRLEEQFELPLFEFHGKKKILTLYGIEIYNESKRLLGEFQRTFENLDRQHLNPNRQILRVSGRRELIHQAYKKLNFKGTIAFSIMNSEESLQALLDRKTDIAMSRFKPDSSDIIAKEFSTDRPRLLVHESFLRGKNKNILEDKEFFLKTPAILYSKSAVLLDSWLEQLKLQTEQLSVKAICEDWLTILQLIEAGEGYSVIPDSIQSNVKEVRHIELPKNLVPVQTYYFLFHKNLRKYPAYKNLF